MLSVLLMAWGLWAVGVRAQHAQDVQGAQDAGAPQDAGPAAKDGGATSATGYRPAPSAHADAGARDLKVDAPPGADVVRIPIEGTIDLGLSAFIRRSLRDAEDASLVVLDINTLGGRVDAAIQIRDALLDSPVRTVAFVHPRAISAGALISLACDVIAVAPGATIGAATPIQMGQGGAQPVEEKMVSYFRTEMRATAEAKGRRGDIAEAMVDSSVQIKGLSQAGKLVTLDTAGALKWRIADLQAASLSEVLRAVSLEHPVVRDQEENWAEAVVRFLTDPTVSGLLMSLGTLGVLMELYTPGVGVPGAVGVTCLLLFFGGHMLVSLAGFEEILLFLAGFVLLGVEMFVIPGFGIAGALGVAAIVASLMLMLVGLPLDVTFSTGAWVNPLERVLSSMLFTMIGSVIAVRYLPRTAAGRALVLDDPTTREEGFVSNPEQAGLMGVQGEASTDLRPAGIALLNGVRVDVVTRGDYIASGSPVVVVEVEGARVVVEHDAHSADDALDAESAQGEEPEASPPEGGA